MAAATLIVAEMGLRMLGFGAPLLYKKSVAGYEVLEDQHTSFLFHSLNVNKQGLRGKEIAEQPSPGQKRVLFVGDSITYGGSFVSDDETYPSLFGALHQQVEALNASAGGWSILNEAAWLDEHGLFGSGTVVLEFGENDLFQAFAPADTVDANRNFPSRKPTFAVVNLLERYVLPRLGLAKADNDPGVAKSVASDERLAAELAAVERIRVMAAAAKARLFILYIDQRHRDTSRETSAAVERLFHYAREHDIGVIRPALDQLRNVNALFRDDIHPNAQGNLEIAKALAGTIH